MEFAYQQNHYANRPPQFYEPTRFQAYNHHHHHHYQYQQNPNQYHQQPQPQQQFLSHFANTYLRQPLPPAHGPPPPVYPPRFSSQPPHGQVQLQLPNHHQNVYHHLPQSTFRLAPGPTPRAVPPLPQPVGGLHSQSWYPQGGGLRPVIGGPGRGTGLVSGAFHPGHGPGPSHAGQTLDECGGGQPRGAPATGGLGQSSQGKGHKSGRGGPRFQLAEEVARSSTDNNKGDATSIKGKALSEQRPAGVSWCELCNVNCGSLDSLKRHKRGKKHKRKTKPNLPKKISTYAKMNDMQADNHKGDSTLVNCFLSKSSKEQRARVVRCELCKVNCRGLDNLELHEDGMKHKRNLENLELNGAVSYGLKRKMIVDEGKKNKVFVNEEGQLIEPPEMCYLCNEKFDSREVLRCHLLGSEHKSKPKLSEFHHAIYGRLGLRALYPPCPVTQILDSSQCVQQVLNGAQVSDPIVRASVLPQTENSAPSAAGDNIQGSQLIHEHKEPVLGTPRQGVEQVLNGPQVSDPIVGASIFPQLDNAASSATYDSIQGSQLLLEHEEPVLGTYDSIQGSQLILEHEEPVLGTPRQGVQQALNGPQVSDSVVGASILPETDPVVGASILPETDNVTPSTTGVSIQEGQLILEHKEPVLGTPRQGVQVFNPQVSDPIVGTSILPQTENTAPSAASDSIQGSQLNLEHEEPVLGTPRQGVQQVFNGPQVSDPIVGTSVLPQTDKGAPSATGDSIQGSQSAVKRKTSVLGTSRRPLTRSQAHKQKNVKSSRALK